jgi:hypothetical protein
MGKLRETLTEWITRDLALTALDPPDSDHQRGFLSAELQLAAILGLRYPLERWAEFLTNDQEDGPDVGSEEDDAPRF